MADGCIPLKGESASHAPKEGAASDTAIMSDQTLRIIPLGGLGEVGKNMMVYEIGGEMVIVDAGLAFPRDEHLGVDLILPDFGYLKEHDGQIRALLLTHAHEDHVGALPYLMRAVRIPEIWGTKLTLGLIQSKLDEHGLLNVAELKEIDPDHGPVQIGPFRAEFVRMAHSVPDCVAIMLETAAGRILHTGDYKLDHTPVDGLRTDVGKLAELGNRGIDLLLGDSTNAERPGVTGSERLVGEAFRHIIPIRQGRVLVACFASNVHRMQQAVDVAVEAGRKVAVVGRSMRKNMNISRNLGYLDAPDDAIIRPAELENLAPHEVLILCTGSQGEPMSALTRVAYNDHPAVFVERGDTVILSAKPVPGNELRVHDTINRLAKAGAEVLHQEIAPVHVSGHGNSEEIRTIIGLVRPKAVMPVHGEFRMLSAHAQLARDGGVPADSIVLAENGSVVELAPGRPPRIVDEVETGMTFVDGLGVGDVKDVAIRDRRHLSEDGVLIVVATVSENGSTSSGQPELIARGFGDPGPLLDELRSEAARVLDDCTEKDISEIKLIQEHLHDTLGQVIYDRTGRRPMILPVIVEV
jgi:ribonuclease J